MYKCAYANQSWHLSLHVYQGPYLDQVCFVGMLSLVGQAKQTPDYWWL